MLAMHVFSRAGNPCGDSGAADPPRPLTVLTADTPSCCGLLSRHACIDRSNGEAGRRFGVGMWGAVWLSWCNEQDSMVLRLWIVIGTIISILLLYLINRMNWSCEVRFNNGVEGLALPKYK